MNTNREDSRQNPDMRTETASKKKQLLALGKEAPISRIAEVLETTSMRVSSHLKKTVGLCNFQDRTQGSVRIILLTEELVDKLLVLSQPVLIEEKPAKIIQEPRNIETGMRIKDFKKILQKEYPQSGSLEEIWGYIIYSHRQLFRDVERKKGSRRHVQVSDENKERVLKLAREYIQERSELINKRKSCSATKEAMPKKSIDFLTKIEASNTGN